MKKVDLNKDILKLIDTQIKFADTVFRDFRGKRYGMETCTPQAMNRILIDQYICSWERNKLSHSQNPETSFSSTTWRRLVDPLYNWVTFGEFEGNNPCEGNCDSDFTCTRFTSGWSVENGAFVPMTTFLTLAIRIDSSVMSTGYLPNTSGQATITAQVPAPDGVSWYCSGTVSLNNTTPGGDLWLPIYGDDPYTVPADGALAGESIRFILRDGCKVYQLIFQDSEWSLDSGGFNAFPPESDDGFWNCNLESYQQMGVIYDYCKKYDIFLNPTLKVLCNACFGGFDADCIYCGMEEYLFEWVGPQSEWNAINNGQLDNPVTGNTPGATDVSTPDDPIISISEERIECIDDAECIHIYVKNQCGEFIKDYEIYVDNKFIGKTNDQGRIDTTILHASTNWNHMINFCYCFTTTGNCNQQRIDMVVHQEGVTCEKCSPIQKCADAVKPILDPIIIDPIIFDPNNPDGPTTHQILCFICDEENLAYSVGQYFTVPVNITDCALVDDGVNPIGSWVNSPGDCLPQEIVGCTNPLANNYNPNATIPCNGTNGNVVGGVSVVIPCVDGQSGENCCCKLPGPDLRKGCLDPAATNYCATCNADCANVLYENFTQADLETADLSCCEYPPSPEGYIIKTGTNYQTFRGIDLSPPYGPQYGPYRYFLLPIYVYAGYYDAWQSGINSVDGSTAGSWAVNGVDVDDVNLGIFSRNLYDIRIEFDSEIMYPGTQQASLNNQDQAWPGNILQASNLMDFADNAFAPETLEYNIDNNPQEPGGIGIWNADGGAATRIDYYIDPGSNNEVLRVRWRASINWGNWIDSMTEPIIYIPFRLREDTQAGEAFINDILTGGATATFKFGRTWNNLCTEIGGCSYSWFTGEIDNDGNITVPPVAYWLSSQDADIDQAYNMFNYENFSYFDDSGGLVSANFGKFLQGGFGYNENTGVSSPGGATITLV
jgi:hypothetical protein